MMADRFVFRTKYYARHAGSRRKYRAHFFPTQFRLKKAQGHFTTEKLPLSLEIIHSHRAPPACNTTIFCDTY